MALPPVIPKNNFRLQKVSTQNQKNNIMIICMRCKWVNSSMIYLTPSYTIITKKNDRKGKSRGERKTETRGEGGGSLTMHIKGKGFK
jgi:hypothetical protein